MGKPPFLCFLELRKLNETMHGIALYVSCHLVT